MLYCHMESLGETMKISGRYIRAKIQRHLGNETPISEEAIEIIKEYLEGEANRICEAGVKSYLAQIELRKIQKIRYRRRVTSEDFRGVLN
jgi:hypothetical protein